MIIFPDVHAFDSYEFTFKNNVLSAEASTLCYRDSYRIYDDACDVGIAIRSARTGVVVRFYESRTDSDRDGDVSGCARQDGPNSHRTQLRAMPQERA